MATNDYIYRKGKYRYFRHPSGELTPLPHCLTREDEQLPAFREQYEPLLRAVQFSNNPPVEMQMPTLKAAVSRFAPATIGWFVEEYLAANPQLGRGVRLYCDTMREHRIAHALLHTLTPQVVDVYSGEIAKAYATSTADGHTTLISNLWKFARTYECFQRGDKHNPTIDRIRHHKADPDGHLAWTADIIDRFDARAIAERPDLHRYRMGLHYTGQRGGDVVAMRWADYEDRTGMINVLQQKTGTRVWINCPKPLRTMLDGMERVSEFIFTNTRDDAFGSSNTLSNALRLLLRDCGVTGYSMHGLRKNAGMELALAGCSVGEIQAVLGHKSERMALFYTKQADRIRMSKSATAKWDALIEAEAHERAEAKTEAVAKRRRSIKAVA